MQLNPARGRKLKDITGRGPIHFTGFMQLNPARGRKLDNVGIIDQRPGHGLCSSTPRGDGNTSFPVHPSLIPAVYAAQPREGTETRPT